ncbi:sulfite exporter TauE/SafE family protein [Candidatus Methylocalor cossyra]|uniref:Heavy metal transport/detoxification protein n=1 Tax=Candidatus Methylocalor cossyra TaxID=3108543 RepID=A0ABP1C3Z0_9GAMM
MVLRTQTLRIGGMHCQGCETVIERAVARLAGVRAVKASYGTGTLKVTFDRAQTPPDLIAETIQRQGYQCLALPARASPLGTLGRVLVALVGLAAIGALLAVGGALAERFEVPQFERGMSDGLLFLAGLATGCHCIGMCGGFVVGYVTRAARRSLGSAVLPHLLYGFGKLLSYTVIGGAFGLLGGVIAFTPALRGYAAIAAGAFLILFGLRLLDWFPGLSHLRIPMPRCLARWVGGTARRHRGPLLVGLLNGLMIACGPLQAMYVMAAGSGSGIEGARMLLIFGLGTLPLMLGFGLLTGMVSNQVTRGLLKASAVVVVTLGLLMVNRGLVLEASGYDLRSLAARAQRQWGALTDTLGRPTLTWNTHDFPWLELHWETPRVAGPPPAPTEILVIRSELTGEGFQPDNFTFKADVPVRWIIDGKAITPCNRRLVVPALGLDLELHLGPNLVEFTPREPGLIRWSCWMGMLRGTFVIE